MGLLRQRRCTEKQRQACQYDWDGNGWKLDNRIKIEFLSRDKSSSHQGSTCLIIPEKQFRERRRYDSQIYHKHRRNQDL